MTHKTIDVFGVKSTLIKSYVERETVDERFREALSSGNEVIVYGSSKQGKTSLILKHLRPEDYIKVECSPQTTTIDIYKSVLRQLGVTFLESESVEASYEHGGKVGGGFKVKVPFFGSGDVKAELSDRAKDGTSRTQTHIEYNLALAQDVSELLQTHSFSKFVVLENFHYLPHEVQEALAYDLRIFQDHHFVFIVLGIWREANRLVQFNGDLLDRVTEVPVEPWDKADFFSVLEKGEALLNVDFSEVREELVAESFDSVGVVQELCKLCCLDAGVKETSASKVAITKANLDKAKKDKANEYGVRHVRNFESFVDVRVRKSAQSGKPSLAYPYYFVRLLLTQDFEDIQKGLTRGRLLDEIRKIHHRPEDVRSSDLGQFLHNLTQHQIAKRIQPPFVDYDRGGKVLKIIDSSLYFFLRHCDREEILEDIPNPIEEI
ncbi:hypothetical protein HG264_16570 [Pseudomonas sp. gcc21]|uniref:hypothetical protein n=1 Tax=Pseudomonas sp. gcc21 TaxID=2726989 RepID=UPI0014519A20|nr:hypothetical protein [Pseudomonas sp. gcc21]QJD60373.1 hypothetical protein HG264_16570 [Pseudomonas sp. gcc21]